MTVYMQVHNSVQIYFYLSSTIQPNDGEPAIRVFINTPIEIKDNYYCKPIGRTDLLKAPENFPLAESRYTLKELTLVWYIYGGSDLTEGDRRIGERVSTHVKYRYGLQDRTVIHQNWTLLYTAKMARDFVYCMSVCASIPEPVS